MRWTSAAPALLIALATAPPASSQVIVAPDGARIELVPAEPAKADAIEAAKAAIEAAKAVAEAADKAAREAAMPDEKKPGAPVEEMKPEAAAADKEAKPGEKSPAAEEEPEDTVSKLSETVAKALKEFTAKAAKTRSKQLETEANQLVVDVAKELKLEKDVRKKLEELAPKVAEAATADWEKKCAQWLAPYLIQAGNSEAALEGWEPEQIATEGQVPGVNPPAETPLWQEGIKAILTPEQLQQWEAAEKARLDKFREEMADFLAASEGQAEEVLRSSMDGAQGRILQLIELDEERSKKLKASAEEAVKRTLAGWRIRTEKQLLRMDENSRENISRGGGMMGVNTNDKANRPDFQPVWKEAVAALLTPAEQQQLKDRQAVQRSHRSAALAAVLISDIDRHVGFNEQQRNSLVQLAAEPMKDLPETYFATPEQGYYSLDMGQILNQMKKVPEDKLKELLDEKQRKRWESLNPGQLSRQGYVREKLDTGKLPKAEDMDEITVERLLSGFLHREAKKMKQSMQSMMEARLENIVRTVNPSPEGVALLRTASKGAAEEMAFSSVNNLESWVRGQFQNLKPADVPARLQNLYNPYFSERQTLPDPVLWTRTVDRALTEAQRETWKRETDSRDAWRRKGLAAMVVTELEKRLYLPPEKRAALEQKVESVITEYEPDFANYFSFGWHLQGYYSMIPVAMFTEEEMTAHFDKKQLETVKDKCLGHSTQYVEMIRRNHESRTGKKSN